VVTLEHLEMLVTLETQDSVDLQARLVALVLLDNVETLEVLVWLELLVQVELLGSR
jgi:hypothetical protein